MWLAKRMACHERAIGDAPPQHACALLGTTAAAGRAAMACSSVVSLDRRMSAQMLWVSTGCASDRG